MQSGISASHELHDAFNALVSSSSQRGLIASIRSEELVPTNIIPSSSADFFDDLQALSPILKDDEAAFVILRRHADATDGYVAVTYVPDNAKVRQKMLFASTRLTLVRELGTERFRETLFATTKQELTAEGWQKHDRHGQQEAPLTEEEQTLQRVKEAEAEASHGTTSRNSHANHHLNIPLSDAALQALKELPTGSNNLVQLKMDISKELIDLASTSSTDAEGLAVVISDSEPRYSFFRYSHEYDGEQLSPIVFIYTCPSGQKIKDRMVYALSKRWIADVGSKEAGLEVATKLEASSPSEVTAATIFEAFHPRQIQKEAFSRPKRPGKR